MWWWHPLQHWLSVHTGTDNESGPYYGFLSGAGSDLGELLLPFGLYAFVRRHNCEVHHCWRLGRHATAAGQHVCRKHHPDGHLTARHVHLAHRAARRGKRDDTTETDC